MNKRLWQLMFWLALWHCLGQAQAKDGEGLPAGAKIALHTNTGLNLSLVLTTPCMPTGQNLLWFMACQPAAVLEVRETEAAPPIQRLALASVRLYRLIPSYRERPFYRQFRDWSPHLVETPDMDFDGNPDLLIAVNAPVDFVDRRTQAFLWNARLRQYEFNSALNALSEQGWLEVDQKGRLLTVKPRVRRDDAPWVDTDYRWADGRLIPVRRIERRVRADRSAIDAVELTWRGDGWVQVAVREEPAPPPPPAPRRPSGE